jgi:hypothetical protein
LHHPRLDQLQIAEQPGWLGRGILIVGLGMIPWVFILASTLPPATTAVQWATAWAGQACAHGSPFRNALGCTLRY